MWFSTYTNTQALLCTLASFSGEQVALITPQGTPSVHHTTGRPHIDSSTSAVQHRLQALRADHKRSGYCPCGFKWRPFAAASACMTATSSTAATDMHVPRLPTVSKVIALWCCTLCTHACPLLLAKGAAQLRRIRTLPRLHNKRTMQESIHWGQHILPCQSTSIGVIIHSPVMPVKHPLGSAHTVPSD